MCPWVTFYLVDMPYMWILVMNLTGIALVLGPTLPLSLPTTEAFGML